MSDQGTNMYDVLLALKDDIPKIVHWVQESPEAHYDESWELATLYDSASADISADLISELNVSYDHKQKFRALKKFLKHNPGVFEWNDIADDVVAVAGGTSQTSAFMKKGTFAHFASMVHDLHDMLAPHLPRLAFQKLVTWLKYMNDKHAGNFEGQLSLVLAAKDQVNSTCLVGIKVKVVNKKLVNWRIKRWEGAAMMKKVTFDPSRVEFVDEHHVLVPWNGDEPSEELQVIP
eukprot:CAMPEP_0168603596 /NCGR_PEP_ID=MMETSP0420-20121227/14819_1 /TAXON_ID=498008 /ORGANISM="Pessonella sp." /LENGTH=232 /DNA_ID=CAMNT_0008642599 /DNA_START=68 /DNA_END=762 /DNA_ORIENTATION=+